MPILTGSGRIGRLSFLLLNSAAFVVTVVGVVLAEQSAGGLLFVLAAFWVNITSWMRRLHDLDYSGVGAFLIFLPIISFIAWIYLLVAPGDQWHNQYGRSLRPHPDEGPAHERPGTYSARVDPVWSPPVDDAADYFPIDDSFDDIGTYHPSATAPTVSERAPAPPA